MNRLALTFATKYLLLRRCSNFRGFQVFSSIWIIWARIWSLMALHVVFLSASVGSDVGPLKAEGAGTCHDRDNMNGASPVAHCIWKIYAHDSICSWVSHFRRSYAMHRRDRLRRVRLYHLACAFDWRWCDVVVSSFPSKKHIATGSACWQNAVSLSKEWHWIFRIGEPNGAGSFSHYDTWISFSALKSLWTILKYFLFIVSTRAFPFLVLESALSESMDITSSSQSDGRSWRPVDT